MTTNTSKDFLSLTTDWYMTFVVDPVSDVGHATLREVVRCVQALRVVMTKEQSMDFELTLTLMREFLCLYLHLLNRTAFRFGHEFRCKLQGELANKCFPFFGQALCPQGDAPENAQFCEQLLRDANEAEGLYGCKRIIADRDLSDDAVLTAFAARVCLFLGHPNDILTMMTVQISVLESLCRAHLTELVARVAGDQHVGPLS